MILDFASPRADLAQSFKLNVSLPDAGSKSVKAKSVPIKFDLGEEEEKK